METLKITEVRMNGGTQARNFMSSTAINSYREALRLGAQFPPVIVFYDGREYWMADGFHRAVATEQEGIETIAADVREGSKRDAILYAVGANDAHGLPRNNADKRNAVQMLLDDEEWAQKSNVWIAETCKVGEHLVRSMRPETTSPKARLGKDGKTRSLPKARSKWTAPPLANPTGAQHPSPAPPSKPSDEPPSSDILKNSEPCPSPTETLQSASVTQSPSQPKAEISESKSQPMKGDDGEKPNSQSFPQFSESPTLNSVWLELIENHVALLAPNPEARAWFDRLVKAMENTNQ